MGRLPAVVHDAARSHRHQGITITTLAERTGTSRQAVSQLAHAIERAGLVERVPNPDDGRSVVIRHTEAGRRILLDAIEVMEEIEAEYAGAIGPRRLAELKRLLTALLAKIDPRGNWDRAPRRLAGPRVGSGRPGVERPEPVTEAAVLDRTRRRICLSGRNGGGGGSCTHSESTSPRVSFCPSCLLGSPVNPTVDVPPSRRTASTQRVRPSCRVVTSTPGMPALTTARAFGATRAPGRRPR